MRPLFACSTVRLARLSQNKIRCAYPFPIAGSRDFLFRCRPRDQTRTACRRARFAAAGGAAHRRRPRRRRGAGASVLFAERRRGGRSRLGHPDSYGHRFCYGRDLVAW
jgi:hypothetical protein